MYIGRQRIIVKNYFELGSDGLVYKIHEWEEDEGCFAGKDIIAIYRIATQEEVKNSPKTSEHYVSSNFKGNPMGWIPKSGQFLIKVK